MTTVAGIGPNPAIFPVVSENFQLIEAPSSVQKLRSPLEAYISRYFFKKKNC